MSAARSEKRKFAINFRPHTHHWQMMQQVRAAPTESGVLAVGGARVSMFMTSWGDGVFPVEADFDAAGQMLRLRVELGCDEIVQRQRDLEELWYGQFSKLSLVSARVVRDGLPVRVLYRSEPEHEDDSGWSILAGDESDEYNDDPDNVVIIPLREVLQRDHGLKEVLRTSAPCAFERESANAPFRPIGDFDGDANG